MDGRHLRSEFVVTLLVFAASATLSRASAAANATVPGVVTTYSTIVSAGVEWPITGDDDGDASVTVEYRRAGTSAWNAAQPLWRVESGLWKHGEDPGNRFAGSLFFLSPATAYDVRLTLRDPDGGGTQQIVGVTTRSEPEPDPTGRVRYVTVGAGGGDGSATNPFRGLAAADAAAAPGDVMIVLPGVYTARFAPTHDGTAQHPIAYVGSSAAGTILDGLGGLSGTSNCVDLSNRRYVLIADMTLRNCLRPVLANASTGVAIRGCTIAPVAQASGVVGVEASLVHDLYVGDNTIAMTGDWATIGRTGAYGTGGYGVETTGDGIVVCYNRITQAWDGIDVGGGDGTGPRTFNCDLYGNWIDESSDDATQTDAVHANVRVFRNRLLNCGSAVSSQPCFGGPLYFLFNEMVNVRIDPFKYHQETFYFGGTDPQETSGMIAMHNTVVGSKAGWYESGYWHHAQHRDNLLIGERSAMPSVYQALAQRPDLDYDGLVRLQSNLVKLNGTYYATLAALASATGQEAHGVEVTTADLVRVPVLAHPEWDWSSGYGVATLVSDYDLRPAATSRAVDVGQPLANVDDGFTGPAPDLGCYERGAALPAYGPRGFAVLDATSPPATDSRVLVLGEPRPNPARGRTSVLLAARDGGAASVRVLDVEGRLVRTLFEGALPPGSTREVIWDGRDASGSSVAGGVYLLVARAGGTTAVRRVACVR